MLLLVSKSKASKMLWSFLGSTFKGCGWADEVKLLIVRVAKTTIIIVAFKEILEVFMVFIFGKFYARNFVRIAQLRAQAEALGESADSLSEQSYPALSG